jgi:hypothetical protein
LGVGPSSVLHRSWLHKQLISLPSSPANMDDCVKWMTYEFLISDGWPSISLVQIDHLKVPHHGLLMSLLFYSVDMEDMSNTVSFRNSSSSVPFVLHVDKRGFATVPERLLSLRFNLLQQSLLVEKEEFDHDGILVRTVYQKPNDINGESIFVVFPGSYTVMGGLSSSSLSDTATQSPGSFSSFRRRSHPKMLSTLPSVKESPEFTIISSSSDDDDCDPPNPHLWDPDIVKLEDSLDEDDVDLASSSRSEPTTDPSILSDSFVVSDTPSKTLGSDSW